MAEKAQVELLVELAGEKRDAAARRLGASLAQLRDSAARVEMLERYREEYRKRLAAAGSRGLGLEELRNWRSFFERLEQAVAQSRAERDVVASGVDQLRGRWLAARQREKSFELLVNRGLAAQRVRDSRREQKQLDQFSQDRLCRKSSSSAR